MTFTCNNVFSCIGRLLKFPTWRLAHPQPPRRGVLPPCPSGRTARQRCTEDRGGDFWPSGITWAAGIGALKSVTVGVALPAPPLSPQLHTRNGSPDWGKETQSEVKGKCSSAGLFLRKGSASGRGRAGPEGWGQRGHATRAGPAEGGAACAARRRGRGAVRPASEPRWRIHWPRSRNGLSVCVCVCVSGFPAHSHLSLTVGV